MCLNYPNVNEELGSYFFVNLVGGFRWGTVSLYNLDQVVPSYCKGVDPIILYQY